MVKKTLLDKVLKRNPLFDIENPHTWRATCDECGCKNMEYHPSTFTYHCPKCGYVLEV